MAEKQRNWGELPLQAIEYRLRGALRPRETNEGKTVYSVDFIRLFLEVDSETDGRGFTNDFFRALIFAYQAMLALKEQKLVDPETKRQFSFILSILRFMVNRAYKNSPSLKEDYD